MSHRTAHQHRRTSRQLFPTEKVLPAEQKLFFSHAIIIDENNDVSTINLHGPLSVSIFPPDNAELEDVKRRQNWSKGDKVKIFWPKLGICLVTVYSMCTNQLHAQEQQRKAEKEKQNESYHRKKLLSNSINSKNKDVMNKTFSTGTKAFNIGPETSFQNSFSEEPYNVTINSEEDSDESRLAAPSNKKNNELSSAFKCCDCNNRLDKMENKLDLLLECNMRLKDESSKLFKGILTLATQIKKMRSALPKDGEDVAVCPETESLYTTKKVYFWDHDITMQVNKWVALNCKSYDAGSVAIAIGSQLFGDRNLRYWAFTAMSKSRRLSRKPYWEKDLSGYNTFTQIMSDFYDRFKIPNNDINSHNIVAKRQKFIEKAKAILNQWGLDTPKRKGRVAKALYWEFLERGIKPFPAWTIRDEIIVGEQQFEAQNDYNDVLEEQNTVLAQVKSFPEFSAEAETLLRAPVRCKRIRQRQQIENYNDQQIENINMDDSDEYLNSS